MNSVRGSTATGLPERSRLDAAPVGRRDVLGLAALWSAGVTLLFAALGVARLPRAAVVPVALHTVRVTLPEGLSPGQPFVPPGKSFALFRDGNQVWALSTVCTHLGCIVKQQGSGFTCPCHGSLFAANGAVEKGPAPRALPWLAVAALDETTVLVDESTTVPEGTRVTV